MHRKDTVARQRKLALYAKIEDAPEVALKGQVFTKPHIVELILDLVGYDPSRPLFQNRLLDPGCGDGRFLTGAASRLVKSLSPGKSTAHISDSLVGVEKDKVVAEECKRSVTDTLIAEGLSKRTSVRLADRWVICDDFALKEFEAPFDFVVGNPPYVRQEAIEKKLLSEYRLKFPCLYDRADLYVVFFEHGLKQLSNGGVLGFICPDRFVKNKYGEPLRKLIADGFGVRAVVDLSSTTPFEPEVCCYPGIFVVAKEKQKSVQFFRTGDAGEKACKTIGKVARVKGKTNGSGVVHYQYDEWFKGGSQWTLESPEHTRILAKLERKTIPLGNSDSGCKVSIGVATGADNIFIVQRGQVQIEEDLLLPLATTKDIESGKVDWTGKHLINPFSADDSGELIDFKRFPKAAKYFKANKERLAGRNVGKRNPSRWYRTIDRVHASLTSTPKLLIPDIKAKNLVVYEEGKLYPHHNLYYIVSNQWNLKALQCILRSSIAKFFVWMYGVKMRGGYLRFQAQYLRKISVPRIESIDRTTLDDLVKMADEQDQEELDRLVAKVYGLTKKDLKLVQGLL